jgi:hypothetical protein
VGMNPKSKAHTKTFFMIFFILHKRTGLFDTQKVKIGQFT